MAWSQISDLDNTYIAKNRALNPRHREASPKSARPCKWRRTSRPVTVMVFAAMGNKNGLGKFSMKFGIFVFGDNHPDLGRSISAITRKSEHG